MDYVANLIASLRLGYQTYLKKIYVNVNLFSLKILACILNLNFILGFSLFNKNVVCITLKYTQFNLPAIKNLLLISRRGKRIYWGYLQLKRYGSLFLTVQNAGILLFSTPLGLL
jgi:ribosomal protein S8